MEAGLPLYTLPEAADENYVYNPEEGNGEGDLDVKLGDINGDSVINVSDLTLCMNHILGKMELKEEQFQAADVKTDGVINISDLTKIMNYILGKIDDF